MADVAGVACGPRVADDDGEDVADPDGDGNDCDGSACSPGPLGGERQLNCAGSLGMGECIDGKCGPVPMNCVGERSLEDTCTEVCTAKGEGVIFGNEGRERLMREAQALGRLAHPNIVAVHDVGTVGEQVRPPTPVIASGEPATAPAAPSP